MGMLTLPLRACAALVVAPLSLLLPAVAKETRTRIDAGGGMYH